MKPKPNITIPAIFISGLPKSIPNPNIAIPIINRNTPISKRFTDFKQVLLSSSPFIKYV